MARIALALSGGIDSTVSARILKMEGHDVTGFTMEVLPSRDHQSHIISKARYSADSLGIPLEIVPLEDVFSNAVMDYFCNEYQNGRTPNPCVRCNRYVKFGALMEYVMKRGYEAISSGHYARIEYENGNYILKKGVDAKKDQSYFLYMLNIHQLKHIIMPLGRYTKSEVYRIAEEAQLFKEVTHESQEICFIPNNDYERFISERTGHIANPGPILDTYGNQIGKHKGLIHYTIGQRRGIGIGAPEPLYVVNINPNINAIIVGGKSDVYQSELIADNINWICSQPIDRSILVTAKIRYSHKAEDASLHPIDESSARVVFDRPQMAVTPGQSVVFYQDDVVLGGGTIR